MSNFYEKICQQIYNIGSPRRTSYQDFFKQKHYLITSWKKERLPFSPIDSLPRKLCSTVIVEKKRAYLRMTN